MQIEMAEIESEVARFNASHNRIKIRAVVIHQPVHRMNGFDQLLDLRIEHTQRVGKRQHRARCFVVKRLFKFFEIHHAIFVRGNRNDIVAAERRARRVGSVRRVGNNDVRLLIAAIAVIRRHHHHRRQLAVRTGERLKGKLGQPRNFGEQALCIVKNLKRPLRQQSAVTQLRPKWMGFAQLRHRRSGFAGTRVMLHRAGTERIKLGVDRIVEARKFRVMPHHFALRHFGQFGQITP